MGRLHVVWNKAAVVQFDTIATWYMMRLGKQAATHFANDVYTCVETLSQMPTIGSLDTRRSNVKRNYYSFLFHPKYRLIYRFSKSRLYIVAFHATMMG